MVHIIINRCDGCWLRVCEGKVKETRYQENGETDKLEVTYDEVYEGENANMLSSEGPNHQCILTCFTSSLKPFR